MTDITYSSDHACDSVPIRKIMCKWKIHSISINYMFLTGCGNEVTLPRFTNKRFIFCPYCGRERDDAQV